ncbi:hypothetical protein Tsp_00482 [Trichinella spiralis]|uniref:hypothetical protein n=1 Tax=Trichinella spiralis TaxID=6334 RepID=UPI0001EFB894|nr:hypothetical protein Tsp_00482 [Trichinella spiralis]
MYVDDLATSCESLNKARTLAAQREELIASGGFHLYKWASDVPAALSAIPTKKRSTEAKGCLWKTLGIYLDHKKNHLTFISPETVRRDGRDSKPQLLRTASSIFDLLGCLAPFTTQDKEFRAEIEALVRHGRVAAHSHISQFDPYMDECGLLRAGGDRLVNSDLSASMQYPAILPGNHELTSGLIHRCHQRQLPARAEQTLAFLRQRYWVPKGRHQVKRMTRECMECRHVTARPAQPRMAALPRDRAVQALAMSQEAASELRQLWQTVDVCKGSSWGAASNGTSFPKEPRRWVATGSA